VKPARWATTDRAWVEQAVTASTGPDPQDLLSGKDRLYEPVEVAFILGIQQTTVQRMCRDGRIAALKPGRGWRISKSEVERYLKEGPLKP
jgi:excisionase family DNA binding protein